MKPRQTKRPGGWIICHHDGRPGPKTPPKERKPKTLSAALRRLAEDERQGARVRFGELEEMARWALQMERYMRVVWEGFSDTGHPLKMKIDDALAARLSVAEGERDQALALLGAYKMDKEALAARVKELEEAAACLREHLLHKADKCKNCQGSGQNNDGEGLLDEACPDCEEDRIALALYDNKAKETKP